MSSSFTLVSPRVVEIRSETKDAPIARPESFASCESLILSMNGACVLDGYPEFAEFEEITVSRPESRVSSKVRFVCVCKKIGQQHPWSVFYNTVLKDH